MSDIKEKASNDQNSFIVDANQQLDDVVTMLNEGEFTQKDAITEMFDIYWSTTSEANGLNDEEKLDLQKDIFERAKASGMEFEQVLEMWQEIADREHSS